MTGDYRIYYGFQRGGWVPCVLGLHFLLGLLHCFLMYENKSFVYDSQCE